MLFKQTFSVSFSSREKKNLFNTFYAVKQHRERKKSEVCEERKKIAATSNIRNYRGVIS
jgi:hypothetical protein